MTTQRQIRALFWAMHPNLVRRPGGHNRQTCDTRQAFCDFLDALARSGQISEKLADRATL